MGDMIDVSTDSGVATVTLDRPDRLNALNRAMLDELYDTLQELDDDDETDAVIVMGAGDAFCAGADLQELKEFSADKVEALSETAAAITEILETGELITVAAVHGPCLGGGNELAMACDLRVAERDAVFGQPELHVGVIPGFGGTARLPRLIGLGPAKQLVLRDEHVTAERAHDLGLVDYRVSGDVTAAARDIVREIIDQLSLPAYHTAKELLAASPDRDLAEAIAAERDAFSDLFETADQQEGMQAFIDGRSPEFEGS